MHGLTAAHPGCSLQASASTFQFAAFFADCEHELLPISAGRRLVLVYNLTWEGAGSAPHAPDGSQAAALAAAVRAWEAELTAGGGQKRLALPLGGCLLVDYVREGSSASSVCDTCAQWAHHDHDRVQCGVHDTWPP
jgi:hypothetical protein